MAGGAPPGKHLVHCCLLACSLVLLAVLVTCGQVPAVPVVPAQALPTMLPLPLDTRPEEAASVPCGSLWTDGEQVTLRGLYRVAGTDGYLDVRRLSVDAPPCWARFFLVPDVGLGPVTWEDPVYLEVVGLPSSGRWDSAGLWDVQVLRWTVLPLDQAAARAACRQAVIEQTPALQALDWASLALPGYITGTVGFRPSAADLAAVTIQLEGADDRSAQVLMTARGPDLPAVHPLVTRWVSLDCAYDVAQRQVVQIVATIRGEVQE